MRSLLTFLFHEVHFLAVISISTKNDRVPIEPLLNYLRLFLFILNNRNPINRMTIIVIGDDIKQNVADR